MADTPHQQTRLDLLWQAVADIGAEADWLRFYEGFAVQRLIVPVLGQPEGPGVKLKTLSIGSGEVALAFDTEARFTKFIDGPTGFIALTGADLARALAPEGIAIALNPGVSPCETVLDKAALAWIVQHVGAEVAIEKAAKATEVRPPKAPDEALLEALSARIAEMSGAVAEVWLIDTVASRGRDAYLCVVRPSDESAAIADEIATELTRIGQIRAARPFGVAVVKEGAQILESARRVGIGLNAGSPAGSVAE